MTYTHKSLLVIAMFLVGMLASIMSGGHIQAQATGWIIEVVEDDLAFLDESWNHNSLAFWDGKPYICYFDYDHLYCAKRVGWNDWSIETIDSFDSSELEWPNTDMAFDSTGILYVSYAVKREVRCAYRDGTGWHTETVWEWEDYGHFTSIAIDGDDWPHISHTDGHPHLDYVYHTFKNATGWHTETLPPSTTEPFHNFYTSIAVDGLNTPHITYRSWGMYTTLLRHSYKNATGWHSEIAAEHYMDVEVIDQSIAVDSNDWLHVSYIDVDEEGKRHLNYGFKDDDSWDTERVDVAGEVGLFGSMALDPHYDRPYICYTDADRKNLNYAYKDDSDDWHTENVDSADGIYSIESSIAFNGNDKDPAFCYSTDAEGYWELKYAFKMSKRPVLHTVTVRWNGAFVIIDPDPVVIVQGDSIQWRFSASLEMIGWTWGQADRLDPTLEFSTGPVPITLLSAPQDLMGAPPGTYKYNIRSNLGLFADPYIEIIGRVGGFSVPVNKLALLAPYFALTVASVAAAVGVVYAGKRWFRRQLNNESDN